MVYRAYKKPKFSRPPEDGAPLTGNVQGKPAATGEERFSIALDKKRLTYWFRINPTNIPTGLPGWVELDFLVELTGLKTMSRGGLYMAIEIDGGFTHAGARKSADMVIKDQKRLEGLALRGIVLAEIIHLDANLMDTQSNTDQLVKRTLK